VFIWTFLSAVNFLYVPTRVRTLYLGVCNFFWFNFLSYLKTTCPDYQAPVFVLYNKYSHRRTATTTQSRANEEE
jgi:hypothetical protein